MADAVFEIFCEELPATLQKTINRDFELFVKRSLPESGVVVSGEKLFVGITPSRIVVQMFGCGITVDGFKRFVEHTLKTFVSAFPRTMLYPQMNGSWLRPIRSLFLCIDDCVIDGEFLGIHAKNGTYTDKFDFHECRSFSDYCEVLRQNEVEIDYNKRLQFVKREVAKNNPDYRNDKLLEEIAGMSEYCIEPMVATLEKRFMRLPFELIELVLRENQRYVVFEQNDEIRFLIFGGKVTKNVVLRESILNGHKKVISARLEDALYYLDKDTSAIKTSGIDAYSKGLSDVLSSRTFVDDISFLNYLQVQTRMAEELVDDKDVLKGVKKLILDTKLDLATGVVAEFPELQGIIGSYYFGYNFNPYVLTDDVLRERRKEVLYFYLVDRVAYIDTMYKQGKKPTGSGDKYKVKARMDDVVSLYLSGFTIINQKGVIRENDEIRKLFLKRLQKHIEEEFFEYENIKQFTEIAVSLLDKVDFLNFREALSVFSNAKFISLYKRVNGYAKNINYNENDVLSDGALKRFNNNDLDKIEEFLNSEKISGNAENEKLVKYLERDFFEQKLPIEFLKIV